MVVKKTETPCYRRECPKCGLWIPHDKFCRICGSAVIKVKHFIEVEYCCECGRTGPDTEWQYCPNCGEKWEVK